MKVLVTKIPDGGLDVSFSKNKDWIKEGLSEKDELKDYLNDDLKCDCHLEVLKEDVFVKGKVSLILKPLCSKCGKEFTQEYSIDLDLTCLPDRQQSNSRGKDYMDGDTGLNYYRKDEIDLGVIAREQLFLTLPMTYLCREDCPGLCLNCGADMNVEPCGCGKPLEENLKN